MYNRSQSPVSRKPLAFLGALALATCQLPALAGSATVRSSDGGEALFEYRKNMLRMGSPGEDGYAVFRDGTIYAVSGDPPTVMDVGSMARSMAPSMTAMAPDEFDAKLISLKSTGRKETVANIRGEVYEMRVRDEDGAERTEEMVLAKHKLALEFRDALFLMMDVASNIAPDKAREQSDDIRERLEKLGLGVLRFGDDMVITRIDGDTVATSRFELPAEPMDMEGIGNMLGGMNAGSPDMDSEDMGEEAGEGGLFSGIMDAIGGQAERQSDRTEQNVENEINRETDQAVDKGFKKAWGKLFKKDS